MAKRASPSKGKKQDAPDTKAQKAADMAQAKRMGMPFKKLDDSAIDKRMDKKGK